LRLGSLHPEGKETVLFSKSILPEGKKNGVHFNKYDFEESFRDDKICSPRKKY